MSPQASSKRNASKSSPLLYLSLTAPDTKTRAQKLVGTLPTPVALLLALALVGCGGKKEAANTPDTNQAPDKQASNTPPSELDNQALATGPGKASRTIRFWDIEWQSANLGRGWMQGTKGVIYKDSQPAYFFEADLATSSEMHNRLILTEKFKVQKASDKSPVVFTPGQHSIEWNPDTSKFQPTRGPWTLDDSRQGPNRASRSAHLWDIEWQSANLVIKQVPLGSETKSKQFGTMRAAKGVVYKDGQIASTFQTDLAEAFEADDRLKLSGKVVLTSIVIDKKDKSKKTTVLTAKEVSWDPSTQRYTASGNVEVDSPNGYLAPTDKVFASAKLDRIATSEDYFKK